MALQVPDFHALSKALGAIKVEVEKIENLPAYNDGAALLAQNNKILRHMTTMSANVNTKTLNINELTERTDNDTRNLHELNENVTYLREKADAHDTSVNVLIVRFNAHTILLQGYKAGLNNLTDGMRLLIAKVDTLVTTVDTLVTKFGTMETNVATLRGDSDAFQRRTDAGDFNTIMRLTNGEITRDFAAPIVVPLQDVRTNQSIPDFPTTAQQVADMTEADLNHILEALDGSTDGNTEPKKLRLGRFIGLNF